jgi:localization factor PodJL
VFAVEDPTLGPQSVAATPSPTAIPQSLPLPPAELGPLPLRQAAAEGDARAQHAIALRYAQGQGMPQDLTEAARWLERAADAGLAPCMSADRAPARGTRPPPRRAAMHNLAVNLSGRESGTADYALAAKWYLETAFYGLADSQFNLGILAEHGLGMPTDLPEA